MSIVNTPDFDSLRWQVAEKLTAKCKRCNGNGEGSTRFDPCLDCNGTGRVYPFRKPCGHSSGDECGEKGCHGYVPRESHELPAILQACGYAVVRIWHRDGRYITTVDADGGEAYIAESVTQTQTLPCWKRQ